MCNDLPLHHAVRNKHSRVVEILLQHNSALTVRHILRWFCNFMSSKYANIDVN